jgi:Holliday junction resolvase RusA-like endonuclease
VIRAIIEGVSTATAQQKGVFVSNGKVRFFTKAKVAKAQRGLVAQLLPHRPEQPLDGPVILEVRFLMPIPVAMRKKAVQWHSKRPDLDNLLKGVIDALEPAGWVTDDARIVRLQASKEYAQQPQTIITMEEAHALA